MTSYHRHSFAFDNTAPAPWEQIDLRPEYRQQPKYNFCQICDCVPTTFTARTPDTCMFDDRNIETLRRIRP